MGGFKNIGPNDGKKFSSEYQPLIRNAGRPNTKVLSKLLMKNLTKKRSIVVAGINIRTGELTKVRVDLPTKEIVIAALLDQAKKGNVVAIKEVFDRLEGKTPQPIQIKTPNGMPLVNQVTNNIQFYIPTNGRETNTSLHPVNVNIPLPPPATNGNGAAHDN